METEETIEEAAEKFANDCTLVSDTAAYEAFIAGAKWMLEKLQDFDTWKEWKDSNI